MSNKNFFKKILAICIISVATVFCMNNFTAYAKGYSLDSRVIPVDKTAVVWSTTSTNSVKVAILNRQLDSSGAEILEIKKVGDTEWAKITFTRDGVHTGWVKLNEITLIDTSSTTVKTSNDFTIGSTVWPANITAVLYANRSESSTRMAILNRQLDKSGATVLNIKENWVNIKFTRANISYTGWCIKKYLTTVNPYIQTNSSTTTNKNTTTVSTTTRTSTTTKNSNFNNFTVGSIVWPANITAVLYANRSESSTRMAILNRQLDPNGAIILDIKENWAKVKFIRNGISYTGWSIVKSLSNTNTQTIKINTPLKATEEKTSSTFVIKTNTEKETKETLLATFTTSFSGSSKGRKQNIKQACMDLNDTIINPGRTFNWLNSMPVTNQANGYAIATVFSGGKAVQGWGGGICQVSSTLYNACIKVDSITITERHAHGLPVSYVPSGKDATISRGSDLNFCFKNNSNRKIKIKSYTTNNSSCTIELYSVN